LILEDHSKVLMIKLSKLLYCLVLLISMLLLLIEKELKLGTVNSNLRVLELTDYDDNIIIYEVVLILSMHFQINYYYIQLLI